MKTLTNLFVTAALLVTTGAHAQYCMLPGRTPYATAQPGITNFKLNAINRSSGNSESTSSVVVETNDSTVLMPGHTYTVTIVHSEDAVNFPGARNNIRVWIDYNKDGDFNDAGETAISADLQPAGTFTGTFTVPTTVTPGSTRLRATAKMSADAGHTIPTACDSPADPYGYHGEMEDYKVKFVSTTAVNEFAANAQVVSVYPNPASNEITISLTNIPDGPLTVELYDVTGKLLSNMLNTQKMNSTDYRFELNDYVASPGLYLIKVTSGTYTSYSKVLKIN